MIKPETFFNLLKSSKIDFFAGVPDSLLKYFCSYLENHVANENHIICANEGNAIGLASGYYLAEGRAGAVYLQNSGLGNAINPLLSIADKEVYAIPILLIVGWRGVPSIPDEPQHRKQGRVTEKMLEAMEIPFEIIDAEFVAEQVSSAVKKATNYMINHKAPFVLLIKKGVFETYEKKTEPIHQYKLRREDAVRLIIKHLQYGDVIVSTTGMTSREVFECRERLNQGHGWDFLTVGGMGHASQIAHGIAIRKKHARIYCLDGDGALIMHMGGMTVNGVRQCNNLCHIVINNGAHDSVGGQPTAGFHIDFIKIARASGYKNVYRADTQETIDQCMKTIKSKKEPFFLEIRVNKGHRKDLGRPTTTPGDNKEAFMTYLKSI